jgi:hypothetical protein
MHNVPQLDMYIAQITLISHIAQNIFARYIMHGVPHLDTIILRKVP